MYMVAYYFYSPKNDDDDDDDDVAACFGREFELGRERVE
jgi:hypothetical protein